MLLPQISNLSGRGAQLLAVIMQNVPLLQYLQFKPDPSTHFVGADKSTFTGSAARAVNATIQRDAQAPVLTARSLALYGREISVDDVYKMDANVGLSPEGLKMLADRQLKSLAAKLGVEIETEMFTGSDASNRMLGLGIFVKDAAAGGQTAALGFTTAELASMNTQVSLQLNTSANQDAFIETLEKEIAKVPGANLIVCNPNLKARLSTVARRLGAAGETINSFGQPTQTFNGLPIVPVSLTTITQTESDGTNSDCTSLYVLRATEDLGVAYSTNSGFYFTDFDLSEVRPNGIARLQFFLNLTVERTDAMRRLSRIRL